MNEYRHPVVRYCAVTQPIARKPRSVAEVGRSYALPDGDVICAATTRIRYFNAVAKILELIANVPSPTETSPLEEILSSPTTIEAAFLVLVPDVEIGHEITALGA